MILRFPKLATLMLVACALAPHWLVAQQNTTLTLTNSRMRIALDVQEGQNRIRLCGLTAGERYDLIAAGAVYGQQASFELRPVGFFSEKLKTSETQRPDRLAFVAPAECLELELTAASAQALTSIPLFLSVNCTSCPADNTWLNRFAEKVGAANLVTMGNVNPESLIKNTLIGGDCFEVDNVIAFGNGSSRGTFSKGGTNIGLESGVVLCTGNVNVLPGPNLLSNANGGFNSNTPDDPDLAALASGNQYDLSKIEFDFTPTASKVQFDFVFGSEEYCEFVGSNFQDVFGFFISGPGITGNKNIALITGTNTPVTTNNVNYLSNSAYYVNNTNSLNSFDCFFIPAAAPNECELDGWTTVFTAVADVIPCSTYHIKLAIADITDAMYASAVFLRANSFNAGSTVSTGTIYAAGQPNAFEGCDTSYIRFSRDTNDVSTPLTINFVIDSASTATAGADYQPLNNSVVIPAGKSEILIPVLIAQDTLTEGPETIILLLDEACSCQQTEITFVIDDKPPLELALGNQVVCSGKTATLVPAVSGGVGTLNYTWSNGESSATITVPVTGPNAYKVTVSDVCGQVRTDSAAVNALPLVQTTAQFSFCEGSSIEINGVVYTAPATLVDTIPATGGGCDTILTTMLSVLPLPGLSDSIIFCAGDTVFIGNTGYTGSGTVLDTLPGLNGNCDTVITYTLKMLPLPTRSETIQFCSGKSITLSGVVYNESGTIIGTQPGQNGQCDTVVTYTLIKLPLPTRAETIAFCPGESVTIGGTAYNSPGTVLYNQPGQNGQCDTVITYTLQYLTPAPSTVAVNCPTDYNVTLSGNAPYIVQYDLPTAISDCPCPGLAIDLAAGMAPGSAFPVGITEVCYVATDSCGNTASCCFDVRISESEPCDLKNIGCVKFELLSINRNTANEKTYTIRVTNNCSQAMIYTAFELPGGLKAVKPADNSLYTSLAGRGFEVRNPNFSPFYSIRFSATTGAFLANGESDLFRFTLPPQISPAYIHCVAKLRFQSYYEAHLNTFYCPVGTDPDLDGGNGEERAAGIFEETTRAQVYPNPTTGLLLLDLQNWPAENLRSRVLNSRGQLVWEQNLQGASGTQEIRLPETLAEGLYFLELTAPGGARELHRFVLQF